MSDSLRDQLIKAGLGKKSARAGAAKAKSTPVDKIDLAKAYRLKAKIDRKSRQQDKYQQQLQDQQRRHINQKIKAIVDAHAINDKDAELVRNFTYKGRIRMVRVTGDQLKALNQGSLVVVYLTGRYYLLPAAQAKQVEKISTAHVPDLSGDSPVGEQQHPVPDDLIW